MSGRDSTTLITKIDVVSTPATTTSSFENRLSPTWKAVWVACSLSPTDATEPGASPVATTTPRPAPWCTTVPIDRHESRSARPSPGTSAAAVTRC